MKKFFLALLSLFFIVVGGGLLAACGNDTVTLKLSSDSVEIEILNDDPNGGYQVITAEVSGTSNTSIKASTLSGYENIIQVSTQQTAGGKTQITIYGLSEGHAEFIVKTTQGSAYKLVNVEVYSITSAMEQKVEDGNKLNNFAIRGYYQNNTSIWCGKFFSEDELIQFTPSQQSRRTLTWSLLDESPYASVWRDSSSNVEISIAPQYTQDTITLIAETERGVTTQITLPVLDYIDKGVDLYWGYDFNVIGTFGKVDDDNNAIKIVPNVPDDESYEAFVYIDNAGDLEVKPYVIPVREYDSYLAHKEYGETLNVIPYAVDDVEVVEYRYYGEEEKPVFQISSNKTKGSFNGEYVLFFEVGYKDYAYAVSTLDIAPVFISVGEKVNKIVVSTDDVYDLSGKTQVIYSEYGAASEKGEKLNISILPTTVIGKSDKYSISVTTPNVGQIVPDDQAPVEFWVKENNIWRELSFEVAGNVYTFSDISAETIYMKASSDLLQQAIGNVAIEFRSEDNPDVSSTFSLKLVKSVSSDDMEFENADFKVDSSERVGDVTITKQFTINGQSTVEGLYIINNSEHVTISEPRYISSTSDSVTFEITLTLKRSSFGVTKLDTYKIAHQNSVESDPFDIDIFLPLKEVGVVYDTVSSSNSVTNFDYSDSMYNERGQVVTSTIPSVGSIMLKNDTLTPLIYQFNTSGGKSAVADIQVKYYNKTTETVEEFKNLINSENERLTIINAAGDTSSIAAFSNDKLTISTKGVGYVYAVIQFTGKGDTGETIKLYRIVLIESYVSPEGLEITPSKDKQIILFANDTVSSSNQADTRKSVTIVFDNTNVTYSTLKNVRFVSTTKDSHGNPIMGPSSIQDGSSNVVNWTDGRYSISNIVINGGEISFEINALSTKGDYAFSDELNVHYMLYNDEGNLIYDIYTRIDITIKNAQRVESLVWVNQSDEGISFRVHSTDPYYLALSTSPTNSKNTNIASIVTDANGEVLDKFVSVSNYSANILNVNLSQTIDEGMNGYIYILPEDAIYDGQIKYYYDQEIEGEIYRQEGTVYTSNLGKIYNGTQTWYDYLTANAYFISNATSVNEQKAVSFSEILLRINVEVDDGASFDYAYKVYTRHDFNEIGLNSSRYYTIMRNIDFTEGDFSTEEFEVIASFSGGLQGVTSDTTLKLNKPFAQTVAAGAIIKNITFIGDVEYVGFVAGANYGRIENVTIDVNGTKPSTLIVTENHAGGIVGQNYGTIDGAKVLGLSIIDNDQSYTIGGIAGKNGGTEENGVITNSKVEFYKFITDGTNPTVYTNQFKGKIVGGLVGETTARSVISRSYAYSYAQSSLEGNFTPLVGTQLTGALIGKAGGGNIDYAFAFVDNVSDYKGNATEETATNWYVAFIDNSYHYQVNYSLNYAENANFVNEGEEGFFDYVNNGNPHLRDLYQQEADTNLEYIVQTTCTSTGYYKSIAVDSTSGILFYHKINTSENDLTSSEKSDLNTLNSITLQELLYGDVGESIVVSSSDVNIVSVVGKTLYIKKAGQVTLSLYSKQDFSTKKDIEIKVYNTISKINVTWTDGVGIYNVREDSEIAQQKTTTRTFSTSYSLTKVMLGNMAREFELNVQNIQMKANVTEKDEGEGTSVEAVDSGIIRANMFNIESNGEKVAKVTVVFDGTDKYIDALNAVFARKFYIKPSDGVIEFNVSEGSLPITPSTNGSVRVKITTTIKTDEIIPYILTESGVELIKEEENGSIFYYLPNESQVPIFEINRYGVDTSSLAQDGIFTRIYDVNFAIAPDYRVKEERTFSVYFTSTSGSSSRYNNGGVFELTISPQNFTNVDIVNTKIARSYYDNNGDGYATVHVLGSKTAVLAPGTSSVLKINVNPSFAYYDYMELSYSGAAVIDAVTLERLVVFNNEKDKFVRTDVGMDDLGSNLRYTPTAFNDNSLYFRVWVNTNVNIDTVIKFTASFFSSDGTLLTYANYFLSVSYLKEPTITINGQQTAYVAKGTINVVDIYVLADQVLEGDPEIVGTHTGIGIENVIDNGIDEDRGIRTYTAYLVVPIDATAENNVVYVQGKVSREINGSIETKTALAVAKLVDFNINVDNIEIDGAENGNLEVWLGVPKVLKVNYELLPEDYVYDHSSADSIRIVNELIEARNDFLLNQSYKNETSNFYINYKKEDGNMVEKSIYDRLFYVTSDNSAVSVKDESEDRGVRIIYSESTKTLSIAGTRLSNSIRLKLETYICADNIEMVYSTYFTVVVTTYSDEDIPITISTAQQFINELKPSNNSQSQNDQRDYILTSDILLEDYEAFATNKIKSLDGNGYTIFIKNFNVEPEDTSTLNLALFTNVQNYTVLKNIRVNLYNGGQLTLNRATYKTINVAGLAIRNEGFIYNSEVVSFYTESYLAISDSLYDIACERHSNPEGINIKYVNGKNTSDPSYITDGSNWTTRVAGFVLENAGSITNSRVGGDEITIIGEDVVERVDNEYIKTGVTNATNQKLGTFYINGQGDIAGFVLENAGSISTSFVKNIDMKNNSNSTKFYLSGFVGKNYGLAISSYIEGVQQDYDETNEESFDGLARLGSSLKSTYGYISGFVYDNSGDIKDSYSNILISNVSENQNVYFVSGFVYSNANEGTLYNCYSASQISDMRYTQMNFSGVDAEGNLLSSGKYTNCYYFNKDYSSAEDFYDNSTESQFDTGAIAVGNPKEASNFYGFAITSSSGSNDGIWVLKDGTGLTLVEANTISISHRYLKYLSESEAAKTEYYGQNENGKYILPYSSLRYLDKVVDTSLGGDANPIIVTDAQSFVKATGTSTSSNIKKYYSNDTISGNYRLVNDINLGDLIASEDTIILPSTYKAFIGQLHGNGFTISNLSTTSNKRGVAYGLFASISGALLTNFNIDVEQVGAGSVSMVGALAGFAQNSKIINIKLDFGNGNGVTGLNFAGGLLGAAFGNNTIKNITVENAKVYANKKPDDGTSRYLTSSDIQELRSRVLDSQSVADYSYAGGLIGYVDNYTNKDGIKFAYSKDDTYSINNIRVNGEVYIRASVAGGIFGLTGHATSVKDAGITIKGSSLSNNSKILATNFFAGGIVGQSYGAFDRIFAKYENNTQELIENNMSKFYAGTTTVERGATDIFYTTDGSYTQEYIGGLIGYAESGLLTVSYSKLNVVSTTAKYAGGIFGCMSVAAADRYNYELEENQKKYSFNTQYMIYEVYATGDVRANVFAGGIFGVIKNTDKNTDDSVRVKELKIRLLNVNALNYISNYDYENGSYINIANEHMTNLSANFKVNIIVGQMIDKDDELIVPSILSNNVDDYQKFFQFLTIGSGSTGSFGYYQNYRFVGTDGVYVNLFGEISGSVEYNPLSPKDVYVITGLAEYSDARTGHLYTQNAFLNTDMWSLSHWVHRNTELFPDIKYANKTSVLYLDCYNVQETFEMMKTAGSYTKVIVRGLISEGSNKFRDIEIKDTDGLIEGFSGSLVGVSLYKDENTQQQVRIISDRNFIGSVGIGFTTRNLCVTYKKADGAIKIAQGLFVNSSLDRVNIKNLNIEIKNQVIANNQTTVYNIGIIAPEIVNSSISGLSIKYSGEEHLLKIDDSDENSGSKFGREVVTSQPTTKLGNTGIIAGTLKQTSAIEINKIEKIDIQAAMSISLTSTKCAKYNIGTYFGRVLRYAENGSFVQELKMALSDINSKIVINPNPNPNDIIDSMNVGGYIGYAEGISNLRLLSLSDDDDVKIVIINTIIIKGTKTIETLNHGMFIGNVSSTYSLSLHGQATEPQGGLYTEPGIKVTNLNAGGIYGNTNLTTVELAGFSSIVYELAGIDDSPNASIQPHGLSVNNLSGKYDENDNNIFMLNATNANVGVVVGNVGSGLSFNGASLNPNKENANNNSFRLNILDSGTANIGSVAGYVSANTAEIKIKGEITSDLQTLVVGENDAKLNFGGAIGQVSSGKALVKIGSDVNDKLAYYGGVYSNIKIVNFGGAIGLFNETGSNGVLLELKHINFGGVLKVFGNYSQIGTVYAGGIIGQINSSQSNISTPIDIEMNNSWGDVFVEYVGSNFTALENYYFGGIIGFSLEPANNTIYTIKNNNSAMTSHNSRYAEKTDTAHALFGEGISDENVNIANNYYSHSVVLLTENFKLGKDCGYFEKYGSLDQGYCDNTGCDVNNSIVGRISAGTDIGTKLNPANLDDTDIKQTNGITYYYLSGGITINNHISIASGGYVNKNIAIIGDLEEHKYKYDQIKSDVFAPINTLNGYSFVSGVLLDVDIEVDSNSNAYFNYAGLVKEMEDNTIVYTSQVKGKINIGSYIVDTETSKQLNISGLVGQLTSGKISNCSTDVDIIYRAAQGGSVYGMARLSNNTKSKIIENCYTAGSIKTYIDANIHAFTQIEKSSVVNNSFTFTRTFWDDFTKENPNHSGTVITAFGVYTSDKKGTDFNCLYDSKVISLPSYNNGILQYGGAASIGLLQSSINVNTVTTPWATTDDLSFNYGYPVLKFGYLKVSSYATRDPYNEPSEDDYDDYVKEYTYTRLPNNTSDNQDKYLMLINNSVIKSINSNSDKAKGKYILPYDITIDGDDGEFQCFNWNFGGDFDGCGNTISGLKNHRLFNNITNGIVRNLRITDFTLNNNSGILADTITNESTISNLVIQGSITTNSLPNSDDLLGYRSGAITNYAKATQFDTITNMTQFNVVNDKNDENVYVGGFAGISQGSHYIYCSNYGNINLKNNCHKSNKINAGGIIGHAFGDEIKSSYNTASVISGYGSDYTGDYYAGGLVGSATRISIEHSYNSGMIKAGNKSNTYDKKAYAGGIIAYDERSGVENTSTSIDNCYNEGTVEALGMNPTTGFRWSYDSTTPLYYYNGDRIYSDNGSNRSQYSGTRLSLVQTSARNVYAYGIGYIQNNGHVGKVLNTNDDSQTIFNNGSYLEENTEVYAWELDKRDTKNSQDTLSFSHLSDHQTNETAITIDGFDYGVELQEKWLNKIRLKVNPMNDIVSVAEKSWNALGIPTSFTVKTSLIVNYSYYFLTNDGWGSTDYNGRNFCAFNDNFVTYDTVEIRWDNILSNHSYDLYYSNQDYISNLFDKVSTKDYDKSVDQNSIQTNTRSVDQPDSYVQTQIGSKGYYLVDTNNSFEVFNAGIYSDTRPYKLSENNMPFVDDKNAYTVSNTPEGIYASIVRTWVNSDDDYGIDIRFSSSHAINSNISFTITCDYQESKGLDISGLKYVYLNDKSYGILLENELSDNLIYTNTSITDGSNTYNSVIKTSTTDYSDDSIAKPDDGDESYIYFGYNRVEKMLVYIPNATLKYHLSNDEDITYIVNKYEVSTGSNPSLGSNFEDNIIDSINWLTSQTLYFRTKTNDTKEMYFTSTTSGASKSFEILRTLKKIDGTYTYGDNIHPLINTSTEDTFDCKGSIVYSFTNIFIGENNGDNYEIKNGNNSVAKFTTNEANSSNGVWSDENNGSITIKDKNNNDFVLSYIVSHSGNKLILTFDENEFEFNQTEFNSIENFETALTNAINSNFKVGTNNLSDYVSIDTQSQIEIQQATHTVILTINPGKDAIALNDGIPVFAYNNSNNSWSGLFSLRLNNQDFVVSYNNNQIILSNNSNDYELSGETLSAISNYFNQLQFIVNDWSDITLNGTTNTGIQLDAETEGIRVIYDEKVDSDITWFEFTSNGGYLTGSKNSDGALKVSFNTAADKSALSSITYCGVKIYYGGSISYSVKHDYKIKFNQIKISGYPNSYYKMTDEDGVSLCKDWMGPSYTSPTLNIIKAFDSDGKVNIKVDIISAVEIKNIELNENYSFGLLVKDPSNDRYIYVSGDLTYVKKKNGDNYEKEPKWNNVTTSHLWSNYYIQQNEGDSTIYKKAENYSTGQSYWVYQNGSYNSVSDSNIDAQFKQNYEIKAVKRGDGDTVYIVVDAGFIVQPVIYYTNIQLADAYDSDKIYYHFDQYNVFQKDGAITQEQFNDGVYYCETDEFSPAKFYDDDVTYYIKSGENYNEVQPPLNENTFTGAYDNCISSYSKLIYRWDQTDLPIYERVTETITSNTIGFKYKVQGLEERKQYIVQNKTVTIFLGSTSEQSVVMQSETSLSTEKNINNFEVRATSAMLKGDIVLMKDISFNREALFNKAEGINIVGNKHYISYIGYLYNYIGSSGNDYIKDLNLLCEGYWYSAISNSGNGNINISNISIYGVINNFSTRTKESFLFASGNADYYIKNNLISYINVDAVYDYTRKKPTSNLSFISNQDIGGSERAKLYNYGIVTTYDEWHFNLHEIASIKPLKRISGDGVESGSKLVVYNYGIIKAGNAASEYSGNDECEFDDYYKPSSETWGGVKYEIIEGETDNNGTETGGIYNKGGVLIEGQDAIHAYSGAVTAIKVHESSGDLYGQGGALGTWGGVEGYERRWGDLINPEFWLVHIYTYSYSAWDESKRIYTYGNDQKYRIPYNKDSRRKYSELYPQGNERVDIKNILERVCGCGDGYILAPAKYEIANSDYTGTKYYKAGLNYYIANDSEPPSGTTLYKMTGTATFKTATPWEKHILGVIEKGDTYYTLDDGVMIKHCADEKMEIKWYDMFVYYT